MKKVNIFILFCVFVMQFMFISSTNAQSISNRNATSIDIYTSNLFRKVSSNGKFAIGNKEDEHGFILNLETDVRINLPSPGSVADAVTNDGVVFGLYLNKPAYFEVDWESGEAVPTFLPMPEIDGQVVGGTTINDVSADGSICIGDASKSGSGYDLKGVIWDLLTETVYLVEQPTTNEGDEVYYYFPTHISDDGNILSGRIGIILKGENSSKFEVCIWNRDGEFLGYAHDDALDPNSKLWELRHSNMSSNGRHIVGEAMVIKFDPTLGAETGKHHPFAYDVQNKELKIMEDIETGFLQNVEFTAASNDGILFGYTDPIVGVGFSGKALTYMNGKKYLFEDWLKEFYQVDFNVQTTGKPFDCSANGNVIVGNGYIAGDNGMVPCSYIIKLGEIKSCPKPENMYVEVLGNETITVGWQAPSQQYEADVKGYNLYCNDILINKNLIKELSFDETLGKVGVYNYCVQAVYDDDCTSGKTEPQVIEIFANGSCYSPNELTGFAMQNEEKYINLLWEYPDFDIRYDSGIPKSAWANEGLPIYFAIKIAKEDIVENQWNGFNMTDVSFFINAMADYELRIYKSINYNNVLELEYKQHLADKTDFETGGKYNSYYDNFSKFNLNEPISLNNEYNYYITIVASNYDSQNVYPVVYDDQNTSFIGKSDLIFLPVTEDEDITKFMSVTSNIPGFQGNWLLSATVTPVRETISSIEDIPSLYDRTVDSYTVFRDGKELATVMTNQYIDTNFDDFNADKSYNYRVVANYKYACISEPTNDITVNRTSVDEYLTSMINVYPNPVTDGIVFIDGEYTSVSISDIQGRTVFQTDNGNGNSIDLNGLKSGIYFIRIYLNGNTTVKKLIIQ